MRALEVRAPCCSCPLTPQHLLLSFDPAIYRLEKRLGELGVIDRVWDVAAFNDLQAVRGHANIYFRDWKDRALVASTYQKAKLRRRERWFDVETLQETAAGAHTFVAITGGGSTAPTAGKYFIRNATYPRQTRGLCC